MGTLPYVSIIIRASAGRRDLERMTQSALNQVAPFAYEVIVSGLSPGGSAFHHLSTCFGDALAEGRLKLLCSDRSITPSEAWNLGAEAAQGAWLCFAEARDEWQPGRLARLSSDFQGALVILESESVFLELPHDWIQFLALEAPRLLGGAVKAEIFSEFGGFKELGVPGLSEGEFWARAAIRLQLDDAKGSVRLHLAETFKRHPHPVTPPLLNKQLGQLRDQAFRAMLLKNLPLKYWPLLAKSVLR